MTFSSMMTTSYTTLPSVYVLVEIGTPLPCSSGAKNCPGAGAGVVIGATGAGGAGGGGGGGGGAAA